MIENDSIVEILLVEDNPRDVELALRALKKNNLANHVHVVKDGEEALEFIFANGAYEGRKKQYLPRVIFLDLKLPKVDGLEVLRKIKSDETTKMVPVVVMTSSQEEQDMVIPGRTGHGGKLQPGSQQLRGKAGGLRQVLKVRLRPGHVLAAVEQGALLT